MCIRWQKLTELLLTLQNLDKNHFNILTFKHFNNKRGGKEMSKGDTILDFEVRLIRVDSNIELETTDEAIKFAERIQNLNAKRAAERTKVGLDLIGKKITFVSIDEKMRTIVVDRVEESEDLKAFFVVYEENKTFAHPVFKLLKIYRTGE